MGRVRWTKSACRDTRPACHGAPTADHFSASLYSFMGFALARALLLADAVTAEGLAQALLVAGSRGTSLVRALLATRAIEPGRLEQQLEGGDAPTMRHVAPVMSLVNQLPPGLCERLLALPVRRDPRTGTVDVAVVDARDPHPVEEVAHWLRAPVRMVRTSLASMETALKRMNARPEVGMRSLAAPIWVPAPVEPPQDLSKTPAYGSPVVDESQLGDSPDSSPTEIVDFGVASPNIPFALKRKSMASISYTEIGAPAVERDARFPDGRPWSEHPPPPAAAPAPAYVAGAGETDPILDLRRRKSTIPPDVAHASTLPAPEPRPPEPRPMTPSPLASPPATPNAPAPPFADARAVFDAIAGASDRDSILELLVAGTRTVARKVAVLAVKRDTLVGWTCSPELGDRSLVRAARVSYGLSDVFSTALASEAAHLARVPKDATHAPLLAVMKSPPRGEVGLVAVRVGGKPVALVMADELGDTTLGTRRLQELAAAAGEALERLLRDRRKA